MAKRIYNMSTSWDFIHGCASSSRSHRSFHYTSRMRERRNHAGKRIFRTVQDAASAGPVSTNAALQVRWSSHILSVQVECRVDFSREVRSWDGLEEGSGHHVCRGRDENSDRTLLPFTQNPRVLLVGRDALRSSDGQCRTFFPILRSVSQSSRPKPKVIKGESNVLKMKTKMSRIFERARASNRNP